MEMVGALAALSMLMLEKISGLTKLWMRRRSSVEARTSVPGDANDGESTTDRKDLDALQSCRAGSS